MYKSGTQKIQIQYNLLRVMSAQTKKEAEDKALHVSGNKVQQRKLEDR